MNTIQIINESEVWVELGRGYTAKCDLHIWKELKLGRFSWKPQVHKRGNVYAYASLGAPVGMHRLIAGAQQGQVVDHINKDGLDNRRINLRTATTGQNRANSAKTRTVISGYKGVSWSYTSKKWVGLVTAQGVRHYLGVFVDKKRAAMAVDRKALEIHGEFAGLNFEELRESYRV